MNEFIDSAAMWQEAAKVGIDRNVLVEKNYLESLLNGETLPPMLYRLQVSGAVLWIEGAMRLVLEKPNRIIIELKYVGDDNG